MSLFLLFFLATLGRKRVFSSAQSNSTLQCPLVDDLVDLMLVLRDPGLGTWKRKKNYKSSFLFEHDCLRHRGWLQTNSGRKCLRDFIALVAIVRFRITFSASLKFIRLLRVVFSSQQRLNRPAVNAIQWRHSLPENRVVILIGWLSKHSHNYV